MVKAEEIIELAETLRLAGAQLVRFVDRSEDYEYDTFVEEAHENISDTATVLVDRLGADDIARLIYVLAITA